MWQDPWSWKEIHQWFPACIACKRCCRGHLLDFLTSTEYARKKRGDILTCKAKKGAALFFQGEGNSEEQSDTGLRSWYHYTHVAVAAVLHCLYHTKSVMPWWKGQHSFFCFTPPSALFLPFVFFFLLWFLVCFKKQNRTKQKTHVDTILWVDNQNAKKANSFILL